MHRVLTRLERLYKSYEKERNAGDSIIDISVACELADSVPYLIKALRQSEEEKQKLYGKLNMISDMIEKGRSETNG